MRPIFRLLPLLLLLLLPQTGLARNNVFVTRQQLDLIRLLPPPPAVGSARQKQETVTLLAFQRARTPEQVALAQADADRTVFRFADVLGPKFTAENLPLTAALFQKVLHNANYLLKPVKAYWNRSRPYVTTPAIQPCLRKPGNASYPSGHATFGTLAGILLSNMLPEDRARLAERAAIYRKNREIGGVHYPSDVEGGRIAGTVIAAFLFDAPAFQAEWARATAEVRRVLGRSPYLPNQGRTSSAK